MTDAASVVQPVIPLTAVVSTEDTNVNETVVPAEESAAMLLVHVNNKTALFATLPCACATRVLVSDTEKPLVNSPLEETPSTEKVHVTACGAEDHIAKGLPDD